MNILRVTKDLNDVYKQNIKARFLLGEFVRAD